MTNMNFYQGKKVLVTGHTGFKGSWVCKVLLSLGARVIGYALEPPIGPSLFELSGIQGEIDSVIGDIRDYDHLKHVFEDSKPELVLHFAAQPLVRESYITPRYTYETNVMGTVNVCECVRLTDSVRSFLNVTTDKVYLNEDQPDHAFIESEPLDGYDPYSNSKSCSELVTHSYKRSFFKETGCAVSTARAGNVIGGGDFARDRIIPDCIRAVLAGRDIVVRNPHSMRPYQHVLEPLFVYLDIACRQYDNHDLQGCYNVGPDDYDCICTGDLVTLFCDMWGGDARWVSEHEAGPHEAAYLRLNNQKVKRALGWEPKWHIDKCVEEVVRWTRVYLSNPSLVPNEMDREILEYLGGQL